MTFAKPIFLYGLILLPLMFLFVMWAARRREAALARLGNPSLALYSVVIVDVWKGLGIATVIDVFVAYYYTRPATMLLVRSRLGEGGAFGHDAIDAFVQVHWLPSADTGDCVSRSRVRVVT